MRTRAIVVTVLTVLTAVTLLPAGARAHPGVTDTYVVEAFANAATEISPGLCAPGDTPDCVGPEVAQFRVFIVPATTCVLNGVFEGEELPANAPCSFELYGFMTGVASGSKPACGAARFYTSNDTTAFGENKTNTFVFNGVPRSITVEGESFGALAIFTKVEVDDADGDTDTSGDHIQIAAPAPIRRESGGSGVPCVTQPLTQGLLLAGGGIYL